jgi:HlyD family secretion protein
MTAPVLFTIANDLAQMLIHSHVPEADIGGIRPGQRVTFNVDAFPQTFRGRVLRVRNTALRARLPEAARSRPSRCRSA